MSATKCAQGIMRRTAVWFCHSATELVASLIMVEKRIIIIITDT